MSTQSNAIEKAADLLIEHARQMGLACGLHESVAAATILEHSFGMAVADMIGPGADAARVMLAVNKTRKSLSTTIPVYHIARHGRPLN